MSSPQRTSDARSQSQDRLLRRLERQLLKHAFLYQQPTDYAAGVQVALDACTQLLDLTSLHDDAEVRVAEISTLPSVVEAPRTATGWLASRGGGLADDPRPGEWFG